MTQLPLEIKESADGSTTFYRPDINEHYHSVHGAIQESEHVYIEAGLKTVVVSPLSVLEVGFGSGLNAFLTLLHKPEGKLTYHSIEKFPLPDELVKSINYPDCVGVEGADRLFYLLHEVPWEVESCIKEDFFLTKFKMDLLDFSSCNSYDLVYFDAFAPEKQPELWSNKVFEMLFLAIKPGGVLTTYCAKGVVRRAMIAAGFFVERIPGPPGKRQMIRAHKPSELS